MYIKLSISFLKQLPPNPGPAFKNLEPILLSIPIALETSEMSAPVFSHKLENVLIELILWAKKAFAASLDNSELQRLVLRIFSELIHFHKFWKGNLLLLDHLPQSILYLDLLNLI